MADDKDHDWDFDEIRRNTRDANSYGYWKDRKHRQDMECQDAKDLLVAAGFTVEQLRTRLPPHDPPDCEAIVNGLRSGFEVTEFVDQETLESTIQRE